MINIIQNSIGALAKRLGIVTKNLQMWLGFYKSDVIGRELVVNGDFATDSDWTKQAGWTISGGVTNVDSSVAGSTNITSTNLTLTIGSTYDVEYYVDSASGIGVASTVGGVGEPTFSIATGNRVRTIVATSTQGFILSASGSTTLAQISNVTVKEVTQFAPDKSTNSNDAKLFTGKALSFNGNDSVVLDGFTSSGDTFTFAFWAKETTSGATKMILDINPSRFIITYKNGVLNIYSGGYVAFKSMPINEFSRVIVAINGTSISVYINGEKYGDTKTLNSALNITNATVVRLGGEYTNLPQYYFNGLLSDFQIYNASWIQSDVAFDYNNPNHLVTDNPDTTLTLSNLSAYYALSEGSGSIAYDSSGGGNNGTITGATYDDQQPTIPQLGLMDWAKSTPVSTEVTLIQAPNNKGYDILGNSLRLRERGFNLDGSGYSSVVMSSELTAITNGTIQFWLKNSKSTTFVMFNETTTTNYLGAWNGSGDFYNDSASGTVTQYADDNSTVTSTKITDGTWHLYTFTGVDLSLFNEFQISNYSTSSSIWLDCIIDEVTIYDRVLTSKEITNNYKVGLNAHKVGSAFSTEFSSEFGF